MYQGLRNGLGQNLYGRIKLFFVHMRKTEKLSGKEGHAIMNLCMAATYVPDPRAPLGFHIPFNAESGEVIEERWRNWHRYDPINLVANYRANLKSLRGIYIDCGWRDQNHLHYGSRLLSQRLAEAGIKHRYEEFEDAQYKLAEASFFISGISVIVAFGIAMQFGAKPLSGAA